VAPKRHFGSRYPLRFRVGLVALLALSACDGQTGGGDAPTEAQLAATMRVVSTRYAQAYGAVFDRRTAEAKAELDALEKALAESVELTARKEKYAKLLTPAQASVAAARAALPALDAPATATDWTAPERAMITIKYDCNRCHGAFGVRGGD
jgi:hypothetical protein